ncbi:MAG: CAP domain-containing protein [Candidatus Dormibacteria bacterium]
MENAVRETTALWDELVRTADVVRPPAENALAQSRPAWLRPLRRGVVAILAIAIASAVSHSRPATVAANGAADSDLFSLTNQDRASNGRGSLRSNGTLQSVGESGAYSGCGGAGTIAGRSADMINRNYFAHPIPPCGQYVFSILQAYGVNYRSAGENIGWTAGPGDSASAADFINRSFMNSADHRDNILNPSYTDVGVGSSQSAPGVTWSGGGLPGHQNVWMFAEEFAQLGTAPPPPPPPPPPPAPPGDNGGAGTPGGSGGERNSPAPSAPASTAVATEAPTPVPTPAPTPAPISTPSPAPTLAAIPQLPGLPLVYTGQGVITDVVESVLEAYLLH